MGEAKYIYFTCLNSLPRCFSKMASNLGRKAMLGGAGGGLPPRHPMMRPPPGRGGANSNSNNRRGIGAPRDFTPVNWNQYFSESKDVKINDATTFRVYTRGTTGPVLLLLHGGGFSALSWACFSASITQLVDCRCVAIDLRGHGDSTTADDLNLAEETLSRDVADVVHKLYDENDEGKDPPPIVMLGHSMGGAIAIHVANKDLLPTLIGLIVIDVVEGTALEALANMQSFLRGRPKNFATLERAIEWAVGTGHIRNSDSARVSMIGQLKRSSGETATHELETKLEDANEATQSARLESLDEDEEGEDDEAAGAVAAVSTTVNASASPNVFAGGQDGYVWRIDLAKTEPYWKGWFSGMSQLFLGCAVPKLLLLAGVDRLDKDLTIGQMQGKFQMQVLPQSGHAVHEDSPDKVAESVATFLVRNKFAEPTADFNRPFPCC